MAKKYILLTIIGLLIFSACDKKKSGKSTPARTARTSGDSTPVNVPSSNNQQTGTNTQNNYNVGSQWVYLQSTDSYSFQQSLKALVSASMDPKDLGYVSNYGDVVLIGYIDMSMQQSTINASNSRFRLEIWDDYARSGNASEIALSFNSLSTYQVNGGQITLVFQDPYGQIIISGQTNYYDFYGTVSFKNLKSFDGSTNLPSGTLGTFQVPYCGFFRCQ